MGETPAVLFRVGDVGKIGPNFINCLRLLLLYYFEPGTFVGCFKESVSKLIGSLEVSSGKGILSM
ncbi:hypothetical protein A2U01_0043893, partial [Trifolium medium]|nr:hypothetical protein [Trifolium medium]